VKRIGIRMRLFISLTLISSLIVSVLSFIYYQHTSKAIWTNTIQVTHQALNEQSNILDALIQDMDRISAQVIFNNSFIDYFNNPVSLTGEDFDSLSIRRKLEQLLESFNGPNFTASQINVFNTRVDIVSVGLSTPNNLTLSKLNQSFPWLELITRNKGDRLIIPPHIMDWFPNKPFIFSLCRSLPIGNANGPVIVEVQQPYVKLIDLVEKIPFSNIDVYIYNDEDQLLYPLNQNNLSSTKLPFDSKEVVSSNTGQILDKEVKKSFISIKRSTYSGLTMAFVQPTEQFLLPIKNLQYATLAVILAVELMSLILAYWIAAALSSPIRLFTKYIKKLDYDNLGTPSPQGSLKLNGEMYDLSQAFDTMKNRLNHSVSTVLESQKRENESYLQAMQAQMNPHFLYNTLYSIGNMAEESGATPFAEMCYKLISMMRYITLPVADSSTLEKELEYTLAYLELMKLRYEHDFSFHIHIDSSLKDKAIPKLIIQPIIENAFKHAFYHVPPPWGLSILVEAEPYSSNAWSITIADNGSGFDISTLRYINEMVEEIQKGQTKEMNQLSKKSLGGMGLINTFARIRLFYGNRIKVTLENKQPGMQLIIQIGETEGQFDV
jgi:two-component system sensor histidine kinase YesM